MSTQIDPIRKRGRKGNKIADAFRAIPSYPVFAEEFAVSQGVSISVLRQSKRFDSMRDGKVRVRVVKAPVVGSGFAKTLMIWRDKSKQPKRIARRNGRKDQVSVRGFL